MKVLLSAYCCEPNRGSEAAIGWYWAIELARLGHEVWVITRAKNQLSIEQALSANPIENLSFIYYDLPAWAIWWKRFKGGVYLHYFLWQLGIYWLAKSLHQQVVFDLVQHITFGTVRQPSFMGLLGIPFIVGPVAGGEQTPHRLSKSYPLSGLLQEALRNFVNAGVKFDPLMHLTFSQATKIFVTSKQTQALLPKRYRQKSHISLAIGIDPNISPDITIEKTAEKDVLKFLFVGRLIYWKGLHLGLQAFAQLCQEIPNAHFTIIGSGPDEVWLHKLARQLNLDNHVTWIPWLEQKEVMLTYQQHDIFLFPSLHDSGGMVVLEALAYGLPVVCLDLGGPGIIVDELCGRAIETQGLCEAAVIQKIRDSLLELGKNSKIRIQLSKNALTCSKEYQWKKIIKNLYELIDKNGFVA